MAHISKRQRTQRFILTDTTLQPDIMKCLSSTTSYLSDIRLFMYMSTWPTGNARQICFMFYPRPFLKHSSFFIKKISASIHTGNKFLNQILMSIFVLPIHLWDLPGQMFRCIEPVSKCCIIYQQAP